ncbi:MAG TPA: hypothetical protein VGM06_17450 [Polyangiaceae bacterium]
MRSAATVAAPRAFANRGPPVLVFAALSIVLHAGTFAALERGACRAATPTFETTSQTLAGDTLDVEPHPIAPPDEEAPAAAPVVAPAPVHPIPGPGRRAAPSAPAASAVPPPAIFGAVGERYATDLATTFTRAFAQAGSAEPIWGSVPLGHAGRTEVTLVLDDAGHLTGTDIGGAPSLALRKSIERTLALLGPRAFTSRGAVTRLAVLARVSRDDVHDGLHGDLFALSAGSFSGTTGTAFFAGPGSAGLGRRVDVEVRLLP